MRLFLTEAGTAAWRRCQQIAATPVQRSSPGCTASTAHSRCEAGRRRGRASVDFHLEQADEHPAATGHADARRGRMRLYDPGGGTQTDIATASGVEPGKRVEPMEEAACSVVIR
jgi:hypothetical protein